MGNNFKTLMLLGLMTGLFLWVGSYFGGPRGMMFALVFAGLMNFGSYWFSDKIVLAMYRAKEVSADEAPQLHRIVEALCQKANLPKPKIYIVPTDNPNAFATGRSPNHAAVAVTEGILRILNHDELEGVLAHELSHVGNRDTLISAVVATMAGVIMMLSRMAMWFGMFGGFGGGDRDNEGGGVIGLLAMMILTPIAAILIQMAISRSREFKADESAAKITKKPMSLASALEGLHSVSKRHPMRGVNPATSHMFIVNPLSGKGIVNLLSTHPPVEERIKRLKNLSYL
ncbi:zinc metalloprotease HtpX [bacterium]|nr:zinc metalloprotease HtpX [bacterium]